ncbi:uncharacterized protein BP01DRAFT_379944 [Aspergillus saccharolyticus JOP 1030-1]|uniref:Uncharacterized protein n=1 Tax=Aspergillus saccharolyticus JOP 1030-1 TaxID=1450539 RepID=A0A319A8K7_9EURO|nr:hypothetical protein BP01DRAFT_379944 [Aspergillus saccharolyticus JOP 1030-1]PYH48028.1 hypothetical protein BP01DRAFT_379944 [Aspergillus saccharolyticus JOP 1030-1]
MGAAAERFGYWRSIIGSLTACVAFIGIIFAGLLPLLLAGKVLISGGMQDFVIPNYVGAGARRVDGLNDAGAVLIAFLSDLKNKRAGAQELQNR